MTTQTDPLYWQLLDELPYWIIPIEKLIHSPEIKGWCQFPYPNHPRGCPKTVEECSNGNLYITKVVDFKLSIYFVHSEFDLKAHKIKMKEAHDNWSDLQLGNVLYWQKTSRKQLRERVSLALQLISCNIVLNVPEAYGVNVFATAFRHGLRLTKIRNIETCRHIALLGTAK